MSSHPQKAASAAPQRRVAEFVEAYPYCHPPGADVGTVIEALRRGGSGPMLVYIYVLDPVGRLLGVVAMRELLLAAPGATLEQLMLREPFALRDTAPVLDAMRETLGRHFPVYPVCDAAGRFLGVVRGGDLFREQAIEITAQAGEMVGVDAEERVSTPTGRSLRHRHPWLQVNLLTCFVSAAVVHQFEGIISEYVILAVFLPVMTGQAINIGCQSLAVTLRGMTLGELAAGTGGGMVRKETLLGLLNGAFSGLTAALGIWAYAAWKGDPTALDLAAILFLAMTVASIIGGLSGALVPMALRRFGADPASASSIFLTTIAEVAALAAFLGLATLVL